MYKNQLQELAQRSCFNLPSYSCIREGPDHAPRFKATVNFNGEVFESPGYFSTLRQAEHAAAEVALNTLSKRGPVQSLAARILDETSVCKNLLQETAQRAGVSLPVYTTIRSGPKHVPVFNCVVEVGGRTFYGEPAKTKKQAEKNAAMAAWSALKQWNSSHTPLLIGSSEGNDDADRVSQNNALVVYRREEGSGYAPAMRPHGYSGRSRITTVNVRDRNPHGRDNSSISQLYAGPSSSSDVRHEHNHGIYFARPQAAATSSLGGEMGYETGQMQGYGGGFQHYGQLNAVAPSSISGDAGLESAGLSHGRYLFHQQSGSASIAAGGGGPSARPSAQFEKRNLLSGFEPPMLSREPIVGSRGSSGANMGRKMPQQQQRIRGLPLQSRSDRFEFKRLSLLEELQQRDNEDDWLRGEVSPAASQQQARRLPWQSRSERIELRRPLPELDELHRGDIEEWLQGEPSRKGSSVGQSHKYADWSLGESLGAGAHADMTCSHRYGAEWPREETSSNIVSAGLSHSHGFKEDWPSIETKNDDLRLEKSHTQYVESWLHGEDSNVQNDNSHSHRHCYGDDWSQQVTATANLLKDRGHSRGEKKSSYTSGAASSSSFSSIWSRSAQWWGSHLPSSTSSAAAALVNTFGLRPASSMAPPVRVRHAVPVCSAPPPRCPDTSSLLPAPAAPAPQNEPSVDREAATRQLLNDLSL